MFGGYGVSVWQDAIVLEDLLSHDMNVVHTTYHYRSTHLQMVEMADLTLRVFILTTIKKNLSYY